MCDAEDVSVEGGEVGVSGHRGFSCGQAEWQLLEALAGEALVAREAPTCGAISVSNVICCGAPTEVFRVAATWHMRAWRQSNSSVLGGSTRASATRCARCF